MKDTDQPPATTCFAGVFVCALPGRPGHRLVAGARARDRAHALALITARLDRHGVTEPICESLMPCGDWAAHYAGDETGLKMAAALLSDGQVSFLDHYLALPPADAGSGSGPDAPGLVTKAIDVQPLAPDDTAPYPAALAQMFDGTDGASCFALLDAAQMPGLVDLLESSGLDHQCLFRGEAAQDMGDAAPWLVRLAPDHPFTRHLFTHAPKTPWMLWGRVSPLLVHSGDSLDTVTAHFRRLTRIRAEEDWHWLFFRFHAPQTLDALRPVLRPDDARALFGPYTMVSVSASGSRSYALADPPRTGDNQARTAFVLRDAYLRAFEAQQRLRFRDRLAGDIAETNPALAQPEARALADTALAFCEGVGLRQQDSIAGFALLSARLGRDFVFRYAPLARVADPRIPERARKTILHNALAQV